MRDRFGSVRLLALVVYFAGLVFVLVTKNVRMQQLFNIAAGGLICFDSFVLSPPPTLSLLSTRDDVKPKFRPGPLMWVGFGFLLVALLFSFALQSYSSSTTSSTSSIVISTGLSPRFSRPSATPPV